MTASLILWSVSDLLDLFKLGENATPFTSHWQCLLQKPHPRDLHALCFPHFPSSGHLHLLARDMILHNETCLHQLQSLYVVDVWFSALRGYLRCVGIFAPWTAHASYGCWHRGVLMLRSSPNSVEVPFRRVQHSTEEEETKVLNGHEETDEGVIEHLSNNVTHHTQNFKILCFCPKNEARKTT